MKILALLGLMMGVSAQAALRVECTSTDMKNKMIAKIDSGNWSAGFAIKGMANVGEDIRITQRYLTKNGFAMSLLVAGRPGKMEVIASSMGNGTMRGKLFDSGAPKNAICFVRNMQK